MEKTYGIVWREGSLPVAAGKLELLPRSLRLEGRDGTSEIGYDELAGIRIARTRRERLDGRPSVVLDRRHGGPVTLAAVAQSTAVGEIADRLAELQVSAEPADDGGVSYLATPGPGDSDGGEIY